MGVLADDTAVGDVETQNIGVKGHDFVDVVHIDERMREFQPHSVSSPPVGQTATLHPRRRRSAGTS